MNVQRGGLLHGHAEATPRLHIDGEGNSCWQSETGKAGFAQEVLPMPLPQPDPGFSQREFLRIRARARAGARAKVAQSDFLDKAGAVPFRAIPPVFWYESNLCRTASFSRASF